MAGTYKKQEFSVADEQTLLKDTNGTRIVPKDIEECEFKNYSTFLENDRSGTEPVRLSPGWEGTGRPDDELNFNGVTMDQADLELNPPKDRLNIVYFIMVLYGVGSLMPWNMFITSERYFKDYKLNENYTHSHENYGMKYQDNVVFAAQIPNLLFNWINVFVQLGGKTTTRVVWGLAIQAVVLVATIAGAMTDTWDYPGTFFWLTMASVVILNTANGVYQNSVYGIGAKLPGKYTGAIVLGSNISGMFVTIISLLTQWLAGNLRTAAIYYFITALFIVLACFDTYFALPINRFYRYHELLDAKVQKKGMAINNEKPPYLKIIKQCWVQLLNIFLTFFVTLAIFPGVHKEIKRSDANFIIDKDYYTGIMCFLTFNTTAMLGSLLASHVQFPKKRWLIIPVTLRLLFIPIFLLCNYKIDGLERIPQIPILITNDWIYFGIAVTMGITNGYFSSLGMMYCPKTVEPRYAGTAGMLSAATLITGICSGLVLSYLIKYFMFQ